MSNHEEFLFEDFFVSQDLSDPGDRVEVELRGRNVPIYLKRGLSLADREAAKAQAVTTRVKPNGQIEIVRLDEGVFAIELLYRCIKFWPFIHRDGEPVEITRENIQLMLSDAADTLAQTVIGRVTGRQETLQPFTTPSEKNSAAHS